MTDELIARAVQVMREHEDDYNYDPGGTSNQRCAGCGAVVDDFGRHHAEALAAAGLLFEAEWQWGTRDRHGHVHSVGVENEAQARAMLSMTPVHRPVGPWTEAPRD